MNVQIQRVGHHETDLRFLELRERYYRNMSGHECSNEGIVPVCAKVSDLAEWKNNTAVRPGIECQLSKNCWIVTGRVNIDAYEKLSNAPYVLNLMVASPIYQPNLETALREIKLSPCETISQQKLDQAAKGVFVGIVDLGCNFTHPSLRKRSGKTRIHTLWIQQAAETQNNSSNISGREYTRKEINRALATSDPFAALGYKFPTCVDAKSGKMVKNSHGTHVTDIAAGNKGVASKAKIIFVDIDADDRNKISESTCVLDAVTYIFNKANDRPCVVNISLGQNLGPHDGTSLYELLLDKLLTERPNRAIVVAAGNTHEVGAHVYGKVDEGLHTTVTWRILRISPSDNEMQIWYSQNDEFEVEIVDPQNRLVGTLALGDILNAEDLVKGWRIRCKHEKCEINGDHLFEILHPSGSTDLGDWKFRLHGKRVNDGNFHGWIEKKAPPTTEFLDADPNYTLGSLATGRETIVVGSYHTRENTPISYFSSAGPTRDEREKPDVSAPGQDILAASAEGNQIARMSGTSMAAPIVTGLVARLLGQALLNGKVLSSSEIRDAVITTCRKNPPHSENWNNRYGHGRISAEMIAPPWAIANLPTVSLRTRIYQLFQNLLRTLDFN